MSSLNRAARTERLKGLEVELKHEFQQVLGQDGNMFTVGEIAEMAAASMLVIRAAYDWGFSDAC